MQQIQKQHQDRLSRTLKRVDLQFLNRPRPGKKLLVLDLDHTLFDCKGGMQAPLGGDFVSPWVKGFTSYTRGSSS